VTERLSPLSIVLAAFPADGDVDMDALAQARAQLTSVGDQIAATDRDFAELELDPLAAMIGPLFEVLDLLEESGPTAAGVLLAEVLGPASPAGTGSGRN
jgi:hypothetical protein